MITIAHLISPAGLYGKEQWLIALLRHIDRSRFQHIVVPITTDATSPFLKILEQEKIPYDLPKHTGSFDLRIISEIGAILKSRGVDILHSHDYKSDIIGLGVRNRSSVIAVSTPHGWSNARDPKLRMYQALDRIVLRYFDRVVPLSVQLYESLVRLKPEKKVFIKNFIDLSTLPGPVEYDSKLFCFVGRLVWLKRVDDAIAALCYTKDPSIRLCIVGDGERRKKLEQYAERLGLGGRVSFLGFRLDAISCLNSSAALIIPSLTEGISRVAMEAMAMGKPVIGTDIAGVRAIIDNEKTGLLVPTRNPRAIARAMDLLSSDLQLYDSLKKAARAYIEREHSAEVVVPSYERLYESLVG